MNLKGCTKPGKELIHSTLAVCTAVMSGRAWISTHLVNWSTMTRIYLFPALRVEKGLTYPYVPVPCEPCPEASQASLWFYPGFFVLVTLGTSTDILNNILSHFMPQKGLLNPRQSLCCPKCPEVGQSWHPSKISDFRLEEPSIDSYFPLPTGNAIPHQLFLVGIELARNV